MENPKLALFERGMDVSKPCSFNIRCTTNCETPTSTAIRRVLTSGFALTRLFFSLQYSFGPITSTIVSFKLDLESARFTIREPTWRFHQPHHQALPCRHALNWKNSSLSKTLTNNEWPLSCFCTLLISAPLFYFLMLVVLDH